MGQLKVASYCTTFLKPEMLHIYRQITSLRRAQTFVMTKKVEHPRRFHFDDIERIPRPHRNLLRHGWMKFVERRPPLIYRGEYQMLVSILGRRGADMMHIYFGHTGVHLLPFIRQWDKPCLVSFHGADVGIKQDVENYVGKLRVLFDSVAVVLARSQSLADRLIKFGCAREKIRINRTGIPLHEFSMMPREFPTDGRWQILQACRLIEKKGVGSAIRAFAIFAREFPKAEFIIAGKGPLQPELQGLAQKLGVAEKVHFCGFLSQPDLRDLFGRTHIFIHPSETPPDENQEGVPNSILEAMATGLPIIATRHGGIPEAVTENLNGFLSDEGDTKSLGRSMVALAKSPELYARFSAAARLAVAENFDQDMTVRELERIYEEVCDAGLAQESKQGEVALSAPLIESAVAK
jgi:colanic acid/amylovoran biosynthesis glycosyltransferase